MQGESSGKLKISKSHVIFMEKPSREEMTERRTN